MTAVGYKGLEIWQLARELVIDIHKRIETLGRKLHLFLQSVDKSHISKK